MKPLPHDGSAEEAVLAGILLSNEAMDDVADILTPEAFYRPGHKAVYEGMLRLHENGAPIDPVTLESQLRATDELGLVGGLEGLGRLADRYASSHHVVHHAQMVRELYVLRRLVRECHDISVEGREPLEDRAAFVDEAEQRVMDAGDVNRSVGFQGVDTLLHGVFASLAERAKLKNPITGVATGIYLFDGMTGGLQPKDLVILAARPSMGKTALALNIAQHASIRQIKHMALPAEERPPLVPTLIFSAEMGSAGLIERILCSEARVDSKRLRAGTIVEAEFRALVQAADRLHQSPLYIDDSSAPTITEIRARARRFRRSKALFPRDDDGKARHGLIIVDYLQLCRGSKRKYDSREQEIADVSRGLKAVAKDLDVPVLALSQLNRGVDNRSDHRPVLADIRESGSIEQDADVVTFVYRESRYITDEDERKAKERDAEWIIGKARNGPTGTVRLLFRGEYTRFENYGGAEA